MLRILFRQVFPSPSNFNNLDNIMENERFLINILHQVKQTENI